MTIPLKHRTDGLGEFEPNDVVPIEHGGTGATTAEQAKINLGISSGGSIDAEWIKADQVGVINSNIIPSITVGSETMDLEFAKIGGLLWMRGGMTLKDTSMSAGYPEYITPPFLTFNNDYKMQALEKGGAMQTIAVTPNAYTTDGSLTRVLFWSNRVCMNQEQSLTAIQSINATNNLYPNSTLRIFPSCIGVLL